ncbi:3'(2'),5'-bisphosphate nucleotidase CysQ [Mesorhizobium sp. 8]|uniref:3'(2'),5'-bisphosphate nucleotidase CysQ n=1 Tax=Mesorhizobium sp. 8 TaxID=2584466 RepID=UPI00111FFF0B|nr:3'(2'),5'-bisphosphate nucleotidase CysQ [Mesorhizobium sp. 8]QDB99414.1 3'(2'),5'-bisphosphate nucleotidase CysQ [Mesorhizobium sp. 8]
MPEAETRARIDPDADLALLLDAARQAGAIALRYFGRDPQVWMKEGASPVSEADYAADAYLRETLLAARPDHGWLSEETADDPARLKARRLFVVDPIDGTRGFLEGKDTWCVSVALVEDGRTIAGVLECPAKRETYWAVPGQGAFCNGRRITVRADSARPDVAGPKPMLDALPPEWSERIHRAAYVPSLAYRLAMIANGSLDATFVKPNAHDWDIAAADLILHEAGGRLLDREGRRPRYGGAEIRHGALCAGSGALLNVMAGIVAGYGR